MDDTSDAATERLPALEEVFQPWELRNESRRDCEPHRAGFLFWIARISLLAGAFSFLCPLIGLLGLPLALVIGDQARRDLDAIFSGDMDHRGRAANGKSLAQGPGRGIPQLARLPSPASYGPLLFYFFGHSTSRERVFTAVPPACTCPFDRQKRQHEHEQHPPLPQFLFVPFAVRHRLIDEQINQLAGVLRP